MIQVTCESCGKRLQVSEAHAGKKGRCPSCKSPVNIPAVEPEAQQVTAYQQLDQQPQAAAAEPGTDYQRVDSSPQSAAIQALNQDIQQTAPAIWYYSVDGQSYGPVPVGTLIDLVVKGSLASDVYVWRDGLATWAAANSLPELLQMGLDACPPSLPNQVKPEAAMHRLEHFSIGVLVLLHFVTFGIFTLVWLNLMHGRMPVRRHDDPSAGKAIGFMFIPFYNLYWMFFTYTRLCLRLNELRTAMRMPADVPQGLATAFCVLSICGFIPYVGILASLAGAVVMIVFLCIVQSKVNEMVQVRQYAPAPGGA